MSLGSERRKFAKMLCLLEHYILYLGVDYALDEGKRCKDCPNTHPKSVHKVGLGQDIVLYGPDGSYPRADDHALHNQLHDFWDFIGGAERIVNDLNHYSLPWEGVR